MRKNNNKQAAVQASLLGAFRLIGIQALVVVLVSFAWGEWHSFSALTSALLGGMVSIVPNLYFAYRFFASGHSKGAKKVLRTFYFGELFKLAVTVGSMLIVLTQLPSVLTFPFLTGFVGATFGLWFAPLLSSSQYEARILTS